MSEAQEIADAITQKGAGKTAGIITCVLAVIGILFIGFVFVPLAAVVALIGTVAAIKHKNGASIGINLLAWVLVILGLATSPVLLAAIGLASL